MFTTYLWDIQTERVNSHLWLRSFSSKPYNNIVKRMLLISTWERTLLDVSSSRGFGATSGHCLSTLTHVHWDTPPSPQALLARLFLHTCGKATPFALTHHCSDIVLLSIFYPGNHSTSSSWFLYFCPYSLGVDFINEHLWHICIFSFLWGNSLCLPHTSYFHPTSISCLPDGRIPSKLLHLQFSVDNNNLSSQHPV